MSPSEPAGRDYVDARFDGMDKELEGLRMQVSRWSKWFMGAMLSIIGGVIFIAGFIWSVDGRADEVEQGVDDVQHSVEEITEKVKDLTKTQERLQKGLDRRERREPERQESLREAVKQTIVEVLKQHPPGRRNR